MKNLMKQFLSLLLAACCLLGTATACAIQPEAIASMLSANEPVSVAAENNAPKTEIVTETQQPSQIVKNVINTVTEPSDDRIMDLFWDLMDDLARASKAGDYASFSALYRDTDDSIIQDDFNSGFGGDSEKYDKRDGFVAGKQDGYYWIAYTYYIVSGTHPNTHRSSNDGYVCASYQNGKLRLTYNETARSILGKLSGDVMMDFYEKLSPGFRALSSHASNLTIFSGNNYLFLNSDMVYEGSYDTSLIALWQEDNGDVKAVVWYANGTNQNVCANTTNLDITDNSLGTVLKVSIKEPVSIRSHYSLIRVFTIPTEEVLTGTQTWTSMHCSTDTKF